LEGGARGHGPLAAGAAEVAYQLPPGTPIAGFTRLSYESDGVRDSTGVRALVLQEDGCRVALVSLELLLVPDALEEAVRARIADVPLDGLVLAATHTHAGPGGYLEGLPYERAGTAPYDPAVRDAIAHAAAQAIRRAALSMVPAQLSAAWARPERLARNRAGGRLVDARLEVLRIEAVRDATPIAEVALFPAHPTILGKANRSLSGDWAGRFSVVRSHGVRLFFQGAGGDQSVALPGEGPLTPEVYAAALSTEVDKLRFGPGDTAPPLAYGRASVVLPAPMLGGAPRLLERPLRNLLFDQAPAEARVAALRLGPVTFAVMPGEPTAEVGAQLRKLAGPGGEVLSLADGYVGYVEAPDVMAADRGETRRTQFGPELADRLQLALRAAVAAVDGEPTGARPTGGGAPHPARPARAVEAR
jgi:hypothetical protein